MPCEGCIRIRSGFQSDKRPQPRVRTDDIIDGEACLRKAMIDGIEQIVDVGALGSHGVRGTIVVSIRGANERLVSPRA